MSTENVSQNSPYYRELQEYPVGEGEFSFNEPISLSLWCAFAVLLGVLMVIAGMVSLGTFC